MEILLLQFKSINRGQICMAAISYAQFQAKYRIEGEISKGTFGRVFKIREISSKKSFALKKITANKSQQARDAKNEIQILTTFKHPLVIELREYFNFQIGNQARNRSEEFGLIMELASQSVQQLIKSRRKIGSFESILAKFFGLVKVLANFQAQNIAHRDIKPANILICEDENGQTLWKLADFGLAIDLNQNRQIQTIAGSYDYVSPLLKRKFNFRNLKIKTNPFKDDVYSLGITFLEILTGFRKYSERANLRLREISRDEKLVQLIDSMLTEEESRRPCFEKLIDRIQEDFAFHSENSFEHSENVTVNRPKKLYSFGHQEQLDFEHEYNPTKTICKKDIRNPRISILEANNKAIQSVIGVDNWIMCGCKGGEIMMVQNSEEQQRVKLGQVHKKYVGQLFEDRSGNIWSAGGDNYLIKFKKYRLLNSLINDTVEQKLTLFQAKNRQRILPNLENVSQKINLPVSNDFGISQIFVIDHEKYVVGFNDGHLLIMWSFNEIYLKPHRTPIISIHLLDDILYTCSPDGVIKAINLLTFSLQPKFFESSEFITGMQILNKERNPQICLSTLSGQFIYLNKQMNQTFRSRSSFKQIMAHHQNLQKHYCMNEFGVVIDCRSDEQVVNLQKRSKGRRGWNCFNFISGNQMVMGSFQGALAIVELW